MNGSTLTLTRPAQSSPALTSIIDLRSQPAQTTAGERPDNAGEEWMRLAVWSITRALL